MSAPLSDADRGKLVKVLSLLASPVAGERDAAVHAAVRLLRDRRLDWSDVIAPTAVARPEQPHPGHAWSPRPASSVWMMSVGACLRRPELLTEWETRFLTGLRGRRSLSAKQLAIMDQIVAKVRAGGGDVP